MMIRRKPVIIVLWVTEVRMPAIVEWILIWFGHRLNLASTSMCRG
jgi:hypothetical protein